MSYGPPCWRSLTLPSLLTHFRGHIKKNIPHSRNYHYQSSESEGINEEWPLAGEHYHIGGKLTRKHSLQDTSRVHENETRSYGLWGVPLQLSSTKKLIRLPNLWLRDNCQCKKCINLDTLQKSFNIFSVPENIIPNEVVTERGGLKVIWPEGDDFHVSFYPWNWILKKSSLTDGIHKKKLELKSDFYTYWGSEVEYEEPSVCYNEIMSCEKGVGKWTDMIRKYGFCYVDNCPISPKETKRLIERISFIRETHYGGFYDFTSDLSMKDTAYTTIALQPHTDTTYFTDPAGLQMFHLLTHENGSGGASILVDGFKAAKILKLECPQKYKILCSKPVPARTVGNKGITVRPAKTFPVFNLKDLVLGEDEAELYQIRWNNDDRGAFTLEDTISGNVEKWYTAARSFQSIINMSEMQYKTQLKPGRPLIFDNWRILHGRTAFTGKRRICGAYVNHDDYISRWLNTNYPRERILDEIS